MEIQGKIKVLNQTKNVGNKGFRKREIVITTDEQYPQHLSIEFIQDKCDLLNEYSEGQKVKITINLRGNEWINPEGIPKYFNSLQGWRIEALNVNKPIENSQSDIDTTSFISDDDDDDDDDGDLPF